MFHKIAFTAALLTLAAGTASAETDAATVSQACMNGSNMPQALCDCVAERSMEEMSDDQRALMVASFNQDAAEVLRLRAAIPPMDLVAWATFFRTAPIDCARG